VNRRPTFARNWLGYPSRSVLTFAAALALAVLFAVWPFSRALAWAFGVAIVVVWAVSFALLTWLQAGARRAGASTLAELETLTADLPLRLRTRMPLMLVTGDALAEVFGGDACGAGGGRHAHIGNGALWLRVDRPQALPSVAAATKAWRDGRAPDGIVLCVAPALHPGEETLVQKLRVARQAASDAARLLRIALPGYVAVYQRLARATNDAPTWYGVASAAPIDDTRRFDEVIEAAADDVSRCCSGAAMAASAARAASLASVVSWTKQSVFGALADARQPASPWRLHGACWIDCGPASDAGNPWAQAVRSSSSVALPSFDASPPPWPLPQPLADSLIPRAWTSPRMRALAHAVAIVALGAALAVCAAAKNNQALLSRVAADLSRFRMIPADHHSARRHALDALIAHRDELDRHARSGAPLRLSFGMYRAAALVPALDAAIASYQPPAPPAPPSIVTLDSMSLFDPGKALLKDGSTRAIVGALELIRAHPHKRVIVAGHTDSTGTASGNLQLSLARAAAVRDWLADASGIPATRFAIQGYGDTRPIAANDTDAGRARNRRVEITLIPDCRDAAAASAADADDNQFTPGQPACS